MKKYLLIVLVTLLSIVGNINAQDSVIFYPTLNDSVEAPGYTIQDIIYPSELDGTAFWWDKKINQHVPPDTSIYELGYVQDSMSWAHRIRGFDKTNYYECETWFIIDAIDLTNFKEVMLTFFNITQFADGATDSPWLSKLDVMISSDYTDDVITATWTDMTAQLDTIDKLIGYDDFWVKSTLSLNDYDGMNNVTLAFKYHIDQAGTLTSGTERPGFWKFAEVRFTGIHDIPVTSITVSTDAYNDSLAVGSTCQMIEAVFPVDATDQIILWTVNNSDIATIDPLTGVLTGVSDGIVTVTATNAASGVAGSYNIEVYTPEVDVPVTSITVSSDAVNDSLLVGETCQMSAAILPADATDQSISWTVNNSDIATIDPLTGVLTGVSDGIVTVTATNAASGVAGSYNIEVYTPEVDVPVTSITVSSDAVNDSLLVGETCQMSAAILPADATDQSIIWSVDEVFATIDASTGVLTGVSDGIVTVTATNAASGVTGTQSIEVYSAGSTGLSSNPKSVIKVFPTVSNGEFRVFIGEYTGECNVTVFNMLGVPVKTINTEAKELNINLFAQPEGFYIININLMGRNCSKKILHVN